MKRCIFLIFWVQMLMPIADQYKKLSDYGTSLYNIVLDYAQTHSTHNAENITNFVDSDSTKVIFADAKKGGYSRSQVVFEAYQKSFDSPSEYYDVLVEGLHDAMVRDNMWSDASFYGVFANMGITGLLLLYIIRQAFVYFKYERPLLDSIRGGSYNSTRNPITTNGPFAIAHTPNSLDPSAPLLLPQQT